VRPRLEAAGRSGVLSFLLLGAAFAVPLAPPSPLAAAGPSPTPAPTTATHPPTCAERYPAEGPAGVDLQLGCVVRELIGYFGGLGPSDEPQRLTGYLLPIAAFTLGLVVLLAVAWTLHRRASRRIAPATPVAWWSCPACRSLNAAGRTTCYRCGRAFEAGATEMRTDAEPPAPQAFGRRQDRP
jgi:hypothetical protein